MAFTALALPLLLTAAPLPQASHTYSRGRAGPLGLAQLYADGFAKLTPQQRVLAWHLAMASHAGEPIAFDQAGWNNLAVKRLLEVVAAQVLLTDTATGPFRTQLLTYLTRFYAEQGNHEADSGVKFLPEFTPEQLETAALAAFKAGAGPKLQVSDEAALKQWLSQLRPTLFDPVFEPNLTSKSPPPGKDLLTASSNTAYGRDVSLKDLEGFIEANALNSRVVKLNGKLVEQVYRAGSPDKQTQPGLYSPELARVNEHLRKAASLSEGPQRAALNLLINYFQTGSAAAWDAYNIAWLKENPTVDANMGFIESYFDARGKKGYWEALVHFKDPTEAKLMDLLAKKAQYFEDRMPWPEKYRRKKISLPVAKAIALVEGHANPPAGINLPNEQHIREKYGSKSTLLMNVMEAAYELVRLPLSQEFLPNEEQRALARQHGATARKLLVAFHEVTGHASGKVDPAQKGSPDDNLKEYSNTLEEARADLVALYHAFDPALTSLLPDARTIAEVMYRDFLVEGISVFRKVQGETLEEDHQRGHQMTVNVLLDKGVVKLSKQGDKTYLEVVDFAKMRAAVGELLSQLMVIKATGDYAGIRTFVESKGVRFDPKLRDEVVARTKLMQIPPRLALAPPFLIPKVNARGEVTDVKLSTEIPFLEQKLAHALLGALSPLEAAKLGATLTDSAAIRATLTR
ncbi:MAG: dipeptidyl-peptidase 3 family protein [Myxococcaceae bacterium]